MTFNLSKNLYILDEATRRNSRKLHLKSFQVKMYYSILFLFPFSLPSLKKEGRRKGEWIAKIVILSHAFLLDHVDCLV